LSRSSDSPLEKDFERASSDEEEAIAFLASIIPQKDKIRIRKEIESNPDFAAKQHMFLGMTTRNALRVGGFHYMPYTMDVIWFSWLKKAVNLPEDNIVVTDSVRGRIKKYRASIKRPPLRPPLGPKEIESVKEQLERRHGIRLPEIDVRYSDNITHALSISVGELPPNKSSVTEARLADSTSSWLKLEGLKSGDLDAFDTSKFTIFLPKRYVNYPSGLYGSVWHELAHAAALALDLKDKDFEESFAVTYSFIGLLLGAKEGNFSLEKAFDQIELSIKSAKHSFPATPHHWSLKPIEAHNPGLKFRNRDMTGLLAELDKTIEDIVDTDKEIFEIVQERKLKRYEKPFVIILGTVALALLAISFVLSLLHVV
jgi:hypothetical protein